MHSQLASGGSEYTRNRNASKQGAAGILMDSPGPLAGGGGAWVKHSGHQHWRDALPGCVPLDAAQVAARLTSTAACAAA